MTATAVVAVVEEEDSEDEAPKYEFDEAFQKKIAALTMRDTTFARQTEGLVSPDYFEVDTDAALVGLVQDYYKTYKKTPDTTTLVHLVKDAIKSRRIRKDMVDPVKQRLKELLKTDISDRSYVAKQVETYARSRALEMAIVRSAEALEKADYGTIEKVMKEALQVGIQDGGADYDYFAEIANRTVERKAALAGTLRTDGISTGIEDLDKYLYHQGWGRAELSMIMGPPKAGKSMSLGEFGKNASLLGYNVLYVSLEVSKKIIADRLDANIADTAINALKMSPHAVEKAVLAAEAKAGKFALHDFPPGVLKPSGLRRLIDRYAAKGITFDMIIVDYMDLMAPEWRANDKRENLGNICIDLRAIAHETYAAVLTATQTNREGAKAAAPKMTDVSEDFSKVMTVDIMLAIAAGPEEIKNGEARLIFAAHRNGEANFALRIKQDREKMKFLTKVLNRE